MSDPELTVVRRPFEAAFSRLRQAGDVDLLRDELSNMLHHMYRLAELCARRWQLGEEGRGVPCSGSSPAESRSASFNAKVKDVPGALGAVWIRTYDTHEIANVSIISDPYHDTYTDRYEFELVWKPLEDMDFVNKPKRNVLRARYNDYKNLENKPVLDTMRQAFDGLAGLL